MKEPTSGANEFTTRQAEVLAAIADGVIVWLPYTGGEPACARSNDAHVKELQLTRVVTTLSRRGFARIPARMSRDGRVTITDKGAELLARTTTGKVAVNNRRHRGAP